MSIEGIPEGWDLVRVGTPKPGEHVLGKYGKILHCNGVFKGISYVIIRKKDKRYRPFANAAEADLMWNAVLRFKAPAFDEEHSRFRVGYIASGRVGVGNQTYSYNEAFEIFECIDGTPFGVEITKIQP